MNFKVILSLISFIIIVLEAKGQINNIVTYSFKTDTLIIERNQTFLNTLIITNNSEKNAVLKRKGNTESVDAALLKLPDILEVGPGKSVNFPVKYLSDSKTILSNIQKFELRLQSVNSTIAVQESASFYTQLLRAGGLVIDVQHGEIYLDPVSNKADIELRAFNDGLIPLRFSLDLTEVPKGLEFTGQTSEIILEANEEILLPFVALNTAKNNGPADFLVTIRAVDQSGNEITTKRIRVMSVSSNRNLVMREQDIYYENRPNRLSLNYVTTSGYSAVQLLGAGKVELSNTSKLIYNINANYSPIADGELNSSASFVAFENKYGSIKVGNIFENLDFSMFGRGVKVSALLKEKESMNVYAVENNPLLFSSRSRSFNSGHTFAFEYAQQDDDFKKSRLIFLQNRDEYNHLTTRLMSGMMELKKTPTENLTMGAGYSVQSLDNNPENMMGIGLELGYNKTGINHSFYSTNYYSTPNYGGLRRGVFYSENRFLQSIGRKSSLIARFNVSDNRPNTYYMDYNKYVRMASQSGTQLLELGYENIINDKWRLGVFPYIIWQQMQINASGTSKHTAPWRSASVRNRVNLGYGDAKQYITLDIDNGYTYQNTSSAPESPFLSSRISLSYMNNYIGFNSFYQNKPYYISDALAHGNGNNSNMFSAGPNVGFTAFKKRLSGTTSLMYSYYGYNGSQNYNFNSYFRYLLKGEWTLVASAFYGLNKQERMEVYNPQVGMDYNDRTSLLRHFDYFSNRSISIGIEKNFGSTASSKAIKKLELTYFEDLNGNGIREKEEKVVPGVLVKVKDLTAITNSEGTVQFSAPVGKYDISVIAQNGWSSLGATTVLLTKNTVLEVAMVKTVKIIGKILIDKSKFVDEDPNLIGTRVEAIGDSGIPYSTMCSVDGTFNFYLPEGKYIIYVKEITDGIVVPDGLQNIEVKKGENYKLEFKAQDNRVEVEVKNF